MAGGAENFSIVAGLAFAAFASGIYCMEEAVIKLVGSRQFLSSGVIYKIIWSIRLTDLRRNVVRRMTGFAGVIIHIMAHNAVCIKLSGSELMGFFEVYASVVSRQQVRSGDMA